MGASDSSFECSPPARPNAWGRGEDPGVFKLPARPFVLATSETGDHIRIFHSLSSKRVDTVYSWPVVDTAPPRFRVFEPGARIYPPDPFGDLGVHSMCSIPALGSKVEGEECVMRFASSYRGLGRVWKIAALPERRRPGQSFASTIRCEIRVGYVFDQRLAHPSNPDATVPLPGSSVLCGIPSPEHSDETLSVRFLEGSRRGSVYLWTCCETTGRSSPEILSFDPPTWCSSPQSPISSLLLDDRGDSRLACVGTLGGWISQLDLHKGGQLVRHVEVGGSRTMNRELSCFASMMNYGSYVVGCRGEGSPVVILDTRSGATPCVPLWSPTGKSDLSAVVCVSVVNDQYVHVGNAYGRYWCVDTRRPNTLVWGWKSMSRGKPISDFVRLHHDADMLVGSTTGGFRLYQQDTGVVFWDRAAETPIGRMIGPLDISGRHPQMQPFPVGYPKPKHILKEKQVLFTESPEFELGAGAQATVYRGTLEVGLASLPVAIKQGLCETFGDIRKISKGVKLMHEVRDENVLRCYGVFFKELVRGKRTRAEYHVVLELCEGGDIENWLHRVPAPSHTERFRAIVQIASGMKHLHDIEVVHRDLKPGNCLVTRHGDMKICDFGLSDYSVHLKPGQVCGTVGYLPPTIPEGAKPQTTQGDVVVVVEEEEEGEGGKEEVELEVEHQQIGFASDVYAFGVLVWEIWTGLKAFAEERLKYVDEALMRYLSENQVKPDLSLCDGLCEEMKDLISSCWRLFPQDRPSFQEIVSRLDEIGSPDEW